jgi:hypothetical protein
MRLPTEEPGFDDSGSPEWLPRFLPFYPDLDAMQTLHTYFLHFVGDCMIPVAGYPVDAGPQQKVGACLLCNTEQFIDVTLEIPDMHATGGAAFVLAHIGLVKDAHRTDFAAVKGELGRIVQHEHEHVCSGQPIARGLKVASQNLSLADTVVREKTVFRFGVRPVLTGQRDGPSDFIGELFQKLSQPLAVTFIFELEPRQFTADAALGLQTCNPGCFFMASVRHVSAPLFKYLP